MTNAENDDGIPFPKRINVSVSPGCLEDIDYIVKESKLFNTRSDFVFSAIRYFYVECMQKFDKVLEEAKQIGQTSLEIHTILKETNWEYGRSQIQRYQETYPGSNIKQIPIRPEGEFSRSTHRLSSLLYRVDDSDAVLKTIRVAILHYVTYMKEIVELKNHFYTDFMDLSNSVIRAHINL